MIPQNFLLVDEIPLTPNGKVDRRRLPTPVVTESRIGRHEAPSDPVEATIAEIWTKLINPARPIGRIDTFFEMGGHSLLGLQALRQIENKLGVRLDVPRAFPGELGGHRNAMPVWAEYRGRRARRCGKTLAPAVDAELLVPEKQKRTYRARLDGPGSLHHHARLSLTLLTGASNAEARGAAHGTSVRIGRGGREDAADARARICPSQPAPTDATGAVRTAEGPQDRGPLDGTRTPAPRRMS